MASQESFALFTVIKFMYLWLLKVTNCGAHWNMKLDQSFMSKFFKIYYKLKIYFFRNHGLLWLGDEQGSKDRAGILARHNAPHEFLTSQQINDRYKHLNYDSKWFAVLDHTGGTIFARKCLEALKVRINNVF